MVQPLSKKFKVNRRRPVMAVFNYLTKDPEGKRKEGEIRADSLDTDPKIICKWSNGHFTERGR